MKIKTAELKGRALDWALAKARGHNVAISYCGGVCIQGLMGWQDFNYVNVQLALCLEHRLIVDYRDPSARSQTSKAYFGDTAAEAVARCVVAMRLGDEVEVPSELVGVDHA